MQDTYKPHDYAIRQSDANSKRRAILLDWIIEVHNRFKLRPETLYLTVYIVDRYLSLEEVLVPKKELQLVGICAMLIASKYEEIWAPQVGIFDLSFGTVSLVWSVDMNEIRETILIWQFFFCSLEFHGFLCKDDGKFLKCC